MTKNEQIAKIEVQMIELGVVVNTRAKNAQTLSIYLDALTAHGLAYCLYKVDPKDLDKTLAEAKEKHPLLLVGGGDGTIRSAAQRCVHSKTILGVLPLWVSYPICPRAL